ncbi:hypothetical protein SCLCIDRAFT_230330 [Scleroderma citrinum Foug A]|uniref:Uncharacterized protein n=1 Tax=Scleroderma citrinum Foug A TaxID=1036808 RepID=A0A0C3A0N5_9AGAM|nr:hypothetical protein SCLCIDRAFT_230330 [Scleroderma citrinum Foug A]
MDGETMSTRGPCSWLSKMKHCVSLSRSSHTARPKVSGPTVRRAQPFFRTHHTTRSLRSSHEPLSTSTHPPSPAHLWWIGPC